MTTMERRPDSRGKVRDIYGAGENLLMVATDRISAFDFILPDEIPFLSLIHISEPTRPY